MNWEGVSWSWWLMPVLLRDWKTTYRIQELKDTGWQWLLTDSSQPGRCLYLVGLIFQLVPIGGPRQLGMSALAIPWLRNSTQNPHRTFYPACSPLEEIWNITGMKIIQFYFLLKQVFDYPPPTKAVTHPTFPGWSQTLVHTDPVSVVFGVSSRTGGWVFDRLENPLKTGQIGMYLKKAVLLTMPIPKGKS